MSDKIQTFRLVGKKAKTLFNSLSNGTAVVEVFKKDIINFGSVIKNLSKIIEPSIYAKYRDFFENFSAFCQKCSDEQFLLKNVDEIASSLDLFCECIAEIIEEYNRLVSTCICCGAEVVYLPASPALDNYKDRIGGCIKARSETFNKERYACPHCGSFDRSRLIVTYLNEINLKKAGEDFKLLHIAPDRAIERWIEANCPQIRYDTADLFMDGVTFRTDIQDLKEISDSSYDLVICSHVLEHVRDDKKALSAMKRVLRDNGQIIFLVPVNLDSDEIDEEWGLDEIENIRRFGQKDHCRRYSKAGLVSRLRECFYVNEFGIEHFGNKIFHDCGLTQTSTLYVLTKEVDVTLDVEKNYKYDSELCKNGPLVTVIMSAYNHEEYVAQAIESVINQTYKNIEFLVADDFSQDGTASVMKRYSKYFAKEFYFDTNCGGRGRFLRQFATGKYIALMHSDDVWDLEKLAIQVSYMEEHPECGACLTWCRYTDPDLRVWENNNTFIQKNRSNAQWLRYFWDRGNALCNPSSLVRSKYYGTFIQYGGAGRQLPDLFKWIYMAQKSNIHIIPKVMTYMRRHNKDGFENTSTNNVENKKRTSVEYFQSWFLNIRDMDEELFVETFKDVLVDKNVTSGDEIKCEKYFLMLSHENEIMQGFAIMYFDEIYKDTKDIFENKYKYMRTDYWRDEVEKGFGRLFS